MSSIKAPLTVYNGNQVVGFTTTQQLKDYQWLDRSSIASWYQEDPSVRHIGLMQPFSAYSKEVMPSTAMPFYEEIMKNKDVLEVTGFGAEFIYSIPVDTEKERCVVKVDTSAEAGEAAGIDGTVFPLKLSHRFQKGDLLTSDKYHGQQVLVSYDYEVEQELDYYIHWVQLSTFDEGECYDNNQLREGIEYTKLDHGTHEFGTTLSSINPVGGGASSMDIKFKLGNHRGVETYVTMYADSVNPNRGDARSKSYLETLKKRMTAEGLYGYDSVFIGSLQKGTSKIDSSSVRLGSVWEYLTISEYYRLESHGNLFNRGGVVRNQNGEVRFNEGLYHQMRRGRRITYARPGGLTKSHLAKAASYLFQNRNLQPHQRKMKFRVGSKMYQNFMLLFREEALAQINAFRGLTGDANLLPSPLISGSADSMKVNPFIFTEVLVPGIGMIQLELDHSLDYQPESDRFSQGYFGEGFAWSTYSAVIYDCTSDEYSNAFSSLPNNLTPVRDARLKSNVYYIKPEGIAMYWGTRNGRYDPNTATGSRIQSSMKSMGYEFWVHGQSALFMKDVTRYLVIELDRRGFESLSGNR